MNGVKAIELLKLLRFAIFSIAIASCSGDDGIDGTGGKPDPSISGTAAIGKAIASATVSIKSKGGIKKESTTDDDGKFKLSVKDLQGPFLVRVQLKDDYLYSVAITPGVSNIHPITDLIIRNWYKVQGKDVALEFENDSALTNPPTQLEIDSIKIVLNSIFAELFSVFELPDDFDLIESIFDANGNQFDDLLDHIKIHISNGKINIKIKDPETDIEADLSDDLDLDTDLTKEDTLSPTTPTRIFGFGASETEIIVVWTPSTDNIAVAGYTVFRDGVELATTPFPVYWDKNLTMGNSYCYEVQAFDANGNTSDKIATDAPCPATLSQADTTPPSVPTNLQSIVTLNPTEDSFLLELKWDQIVNEDVIAYEIWRSVNDSPLQRYVTVIDPPFLDLKLAPVTKYCYTVKAVDAALLKSAESAPHCVTTDSDPSTAIPMINPLVAYTTNATITIYGNAEPGSVVTILNGTVATDTTAVGSGAFSLNLALNQNSVNIFSAYATDGSQNRSSIVTVDINGKPLTVTHDNIAPKVNAVNPLNGATRVDTKSNVTLSFSEALKAASVSTDDILLKQGTVSVPYVISVSGSTVTLNPSADLNFETLYTVQVLTGNITDLTDNTIITPFNSTFTTRPADTAPTAVVGADQSVLVNDLVQLDGSQSFDPDLDLKTYQWSLSRPAGSIAALSSTTIPKPTFTADVSGTYVATLIVTAKNVASAPASVNIIAVNNTAPTANAGTAQTVPLNTTGTLNGSNSTDLETPLSLLYKWSIVTQPTGSNISLSNTNVVAPTFAPKRKGDYTFELVVNDGDLDSAPSQVTINVPNSVPTAQFSFSPPEPFVLDNINLDGNTSSDPDVDDQLNFKWRIVTQPVGSAATLTGSVTAAESFIPDVAGDYQIELIVNDGTSDSAATVTVINARPQFTPINCGSLISDVISAPTEIDQFSINAISGNQALITLVETNGAFASTGAVPQWSLQAPSGSVAKAATNANSQSKVTFNETGTYVLRIQANDLVTTGGYNIGMECILPPSQAQGTLTPGSLVSGTISSAGQTDIYTFSGTTDSLIDLTIIQSAGFAGSAANIALYSPTGVLVNNRGYNANSELRFLLSETGTYVLRVTAANLVATGNYSIGYATLLPPGPVIADLLPGSVTTGTINAAGEIDVYTFSAANGEKIDITFVQTAGFAGTAANFALFSPTGVLINNRGYNANSDTRFALTETGTYTIRVLAANLLATGTYGIGFTKLLPATPVIADLVPGTVTSGTLTEPGQNDIYTFSATAGEKIDLVFIQTAGFAGTAANFALFSPTGVLINNRGYNANSDTRFNLTETGTYTIRVLAANLLATGTYGIGFTKLLPATPVIADLLPGTITTGTLSEPGQNDIYTLSASAGEKIDLVFIQTAGFAGTAANFALFSPTGVLINNRGYNANSDTRFALTETGTYTIRVLAANLLATGTYGISFTKLLPATPVIADLVPGTVTAGTLTAPGQNDIYTFSGTAGDKIDIAFIQTAGFAGTAANIALFSPTGVLINNRGYNANSDTRFNLTETGTYTIRVLAANLLATGTYGISFTKLLPATPVIADLLPGTITTGTLTEPGQNDVYTFSATAGEKIDLVFIQTAGFAGTAANIALFSPSGILVNNRGYNANSDTRFALTETGTYVLRVLAANLLATGTYGISFTKLLPATPVIADLTPGTVTSGTLTAPGQNDIYTFSATAGEKVDLVFIQTAGFAGTAANIALFSPSGILVNNRGYNANSDLRFDLTETGTYVIRVLAANLLATGTYGIGFTKLLPATPVIADLLPGTVTSGTIIEPGQNDIYTFAATAGDKIDIAFIQTTGFAGTAANIALFSPSGILVNNRGYNANSDLRFDLTETGTYVIRVLAANLLATGDYSIGYVKLLQPTPVTATVTLGAAPTTGSITTPGEIKLYTFTGAASDIVTVTFAQTAGFTPSAANIAVFSPSGILVNNRGYNAPSQPVYTLTENGVYVIRVLSAGLISTGDFSISLN